MFPVEGGEVTSQNSIEYANRLKDWMYLILLQSIVAAQFEEQEVLPLLISGCLFLFPEWLKFMK